MKVGLSLAPSRTENRRLREYSTAMAHPPNLRAYNEKRQLIIDALRIGSGISLPSSPLINTLESKNISNISQLLLNSYITYNPIQTLTIKTEFSTEFTQIEDLNRASSRTFSGGSANGYGRGVNDQLLSYNWTTIATYEPSTGDIHDWDISIGANFSSAEELIEAIILERRVEFFFERNRFHDLMRLERPLVKPPLAPINYDACELRWPIPQSEINVNNKLVQNPDC